MLSEKEIQFIKEKAIAAGKASLDTEKYKSKFVLDGGKKGFDLCLKLKTSDDFLKVISDLRQEDIDLFTDVDEKNQEEYWHHRYKSLQVEWMYEIMKYVWGGYETYSARAGIAISRIMHENKIDEHRLGYYNNVKPR